MQCDVQTSAKRKPLTFEIDDIPPCKRFCSQTNSNWVPGDDSKRSVSHGCTNGRVTPLTDNFRTLDCIDPSHSASTFSIHQYENSSVPSREETSLSNYNIKQAWTNSSFSATKHSTNIPAHTIACLRELQFCFHWTPSSEEEKLLILHEILTNTTRPGAVTVNGSERLRQGVLVFCSSAATVNRVALWLRRQLWCVGAVHGGKLEIDRNEAFSQFFHGLSQVLVTTDAGARQLTTFATKYSKNKVSLYRNNDYMLVSCSVSKKYRNNKQRLDLSRIIQFEIPNKMTLFIKRCQYLFKEYKSTGINNDEPTSRTVDAFYSKKFQYIPEMVALFESLGKRIPIF